MLKLKKKYDGWISEKSEGLSKTFLKRLLWAAVNNARIREIKLNNHVDRMGIMFQCSEIP